MSTTESPGTGDAVRRSVGRSPSYPRLDLEAAVGRARQLYDAEQRYSAPISTIVSHWGYSTTSGPANAVVAALKKFGLLTDEGSGVNRKGMVTDLAVTILEHPDADERQRAIQTAALRPPIHAEMWDRYKDRLPSDANLKWELVQGRGFTQTGAAEFLSEYRRTLTFARLGTEDTGTSHEDSREEGGDYDPGSPAAEQPPPPAPPADPPNGSRTRREVGRRGESAMLTYAVPVGIGSDITIEGRFPLSEAEWTQFMAVLSAMKPALVGERPDDGNVVGAIDDE